MTKPNNAAATSVQSVVMPWSKRAEELEPTEGPYCDYAAWCEWLEAWNSEQSESIQVDLDTLDKTAMYVAFVKACCETAKAVGAAYESERPSQAPALKRQRDELLDAMKRIIDIESDTGARTFAEVIAKRAIAKIEGETNQ